MWIFEVILYVALAYTFVRFDRKKKLWKKMISQEEEFEHYLSEMSASYGKRKNIEEATFDVEEKYKITLQPEHSYVRIYEAMCRIIKEDGDESTDDYSVFQRNLQYLKEEIRENLLLCKAKVHEFLGLDLLAVLPVCFLPLVELWATCVSEELSAYYEGSYGLLTTAVLFAVTFGVYGLILWLLLPQDGKQNRYRFEEYLLQFHWISHWLDSYMQKNYTKCLRKNEQIKQLQGYGNIRAFLMKKRCFFVAGLLGSSLFVLLYLGAERTQIITQTRIPSYQLLLLREEEQKDVKEKYRMLLSELSKSSDRKDIEDFFTKTVEKLPLWNELQEELHIGQSDAAKMELQAAIYDQITEYGQIKFRWYHLIMIAAIAFFIAQIPEIYLAAEQWKSKEKRMSECLRLQTVVLLLAHYERTTVEELLSYMENFAEIFKSRIAEAVDRFSYHRTETLQKLRQEIPDEPIQRICDALEFCDELPVKEAFLNLEDEREYFMKKNMEERKNYQKDSFALAKTIAYLPLFLLIILKLVIPFAAEGLSELNSYSRFVY